MIIKSTATVIVALRISKGFRNICLLIIMSIPNTARNDKNNFAIGEIKAK